MDDFRSLKNSEMVSLTQFEKGKPKTQSDKSYITGYFISSTPDQGKDKNSTVHLFDVTNIEGEVIEPAQEKGMWGSKVLDDQLAKVQPGQLVMIKWLGLRKPKTGGREYHDYEVFISKSQSKAVDASRKMVIESENHEMVHAADRVAATAGGDSDLPF